MGFSKKADLLGAKIASLAPVVALSLVGLLSGLSIGELLGGFVAISLPDILVRFGFIAC